LSGSVGGIVRRIEDSGDFIVANLRLTINREILEENRI